MGQVVARIDPLIVTPMKYPAFAQTDAFDPIANITIARGTVMGAVTTAVNDVDTVTMTGTAGNWSITIQNNNGTYTAATLAFNISTAALQTAIQALPNIGAGNVLVTGTAGTSYVLTGAGALAGYPIGIVTVDPTNGGVTPLTGGTVSVVHTTTDIIAGQIKAYASGNSDGSQIPIGISLFDFTTDQNGNITLGGAQSNVYGSFSAPQFGISMGHTETVPLYISGWFYEADLVGLDANAVTKFFAREFTLPGAAKAVRIP